MKDFRPRQVLLVVLFVAGLFHALTMREGIWLGSDASLYIAHARNIVEGRPYAETGYVYNPSRAEHSPQAYPPVFPLMIAPAYAVFGLNVTWMKLIVIASLLLGMYFAFGVFRPVVGADLALLIVIAVLANPEIWNIKNDVLTDIPFLAAVFGAVWFWENRLERTKGKARWWAWALLGGLLLYIPYGIRTVGVAVIGAVTMNQLLSRRVRWRSAALALVICVVLVFIQKQFVPGGPAYLETFREFTFDGLFWRVKTYTLGFAWLWFGLVWMRWSLLLIGLLGSLAFVGWVWQLRDASALAWFTPLYMGIVLVWPGYAGLRLMLPIIPLVLFFATAGAMRLARFPFLGRATTVLLVILGLTMGLTHVRYYRNADYGPLPEGYDRPEVEELMTVVRQAPSTAVFVFEIPRALALLGERRASTFDVRISDAEQWVYMKSIEASHVVVHKNDKEGKRYLLSFMTRYPESFQQVLSGQAFDVFEIDQYPVVDRIENTPDSGRSQGD